MAHPTDGEREVRIPEIFGHRKIPFRLEPSDRERLEVALPFMFMRLDHMGFKGQLDATATVVDGLGNCYEAKPFRVDLRNRASLRTPLKN